MCKLPCARLAALALAPGGVEVSVMELAVQGLVGACCLFLVGLGVTTLFVPKLMVGVLAVEPKGPAGWNTLRGFLGGLFVGSATVLATGLATGNRTFILAVAMVMSVVVFGRFVGLLLDGFAKGIVFPLVMEMIMVAI